MVIQGIKLTGKQPTTIEITLLTLGCTILLNRDKRIMMICLWWLSQRLVTYGRHLLVTICLHVAPSPGCHSINYSKSISCSWTTISSF